MRLTDRWFVPDEYHDDIYGVDLDRLKDAGIRAVLVDIDNTLVTYDDPEPTERVLRWFDELKKRNIQIALISNNNNKRVKLFNSRLGFYAYSKSGKPSPRCYDDALRKMGVGREECAVIGDQVFTDVWSGRLIGAYTVLVKPIKDKTSLFFKFKRVLEKPVLKRYGKLHGQN
ncbi:MAG: YqeG family HAD IIIA-type phosphatase [Clostridia bacterium]|nr:YqeG family HAD IIIA-type phosphatase [Clostridia bacterium]